MKQTGERQYTTYLAMTGVVPEAGLTATHLRVDVRHVPERRCYILSVTGVERKANGIETSLLLGERDRSYYGALAGADRFNRKQLDGWASVVATAIAEEKSFIWDRIASIVTAHGASVAK